MSSLRLVSLVLIAGLCTGAATGAHITDKLVVGLYAEPGTEGSPIKLLASGTPLEVVQRKGDLVEVRMADDVSGWVEARYVTEEKPAKAMLLETQTRLRALTKELEALKAEGATLAAAPAEPPSAPSAREAQLRQALSSAEARVAELEQRLADQPEAEADRKRLQVLQHEVHRALTRLAEAQGLELRAVDTVPDEGVLSRYRIWIVGLVAVLAGFGAGVAFIDYRIRKRYGGFRI